MRWLPVLLLLAASCGGTIQERRPEYYPYGYEQHPPGIVHFTFKDERERPKAVPPRPTRVWSPRMRGMPPINPERH